MKVNPTEQCSSTVGGLKKQKQNKKNSANTIDAMSEVQFNLIATKAKLVISALKL